MLDPHLKENIYKALVELQVSPPEIDLYLASLSLGSTSISKLSKFIGISRPNVYKLIHSLEAKGLVEFSKQKKYHRQFLVKSPSVVLEKFRRKRGEYERLEQDMATSMPEILAAYAQGAETSRIKIFETNESLTKTLIQLHTEQTPTPMLVFGSVEYHLHVMKWSGFRQLVKERVSRGIPIKMLLLKSSIAAMMKERNKAELREVRYLSEIRPFSTAFQVFDKKILFWQPKAPLAILVEDEYLAQMFRSIFEKLWTESEH